MPLPHIKLVWSPRRLAADWRLGLWGEYRRSDGGPWALAVSARGMLLWGGGFVFVGYLAAAAALLVWLDRKPYNSITYTDLALPWRWSHLEEKRGAALITAGLEDLRQKKWGVALQKLTIGLTRNPPSTKARLALAEFALAQNNRAKAEQLLREGLSYGWPGRDYFDRLVKLAGSGENFTLLLASTDLALAQLAGKAQLDADRQWVMRQKLSALLAAGRTDEAARLAETEGETQGPVMREFRTLALLKAGQPAAAVDFLTQWQTAAARAPIELTQTRRLLVRAYREANRLDDMNGTLDALRAESPTTPDPYIYGIVQRLLANRRSEAEKTLADFRLRFGSRLVHLVRLAAPLGEIGEEPMLLQLIAAAREQSLPLLELHRALVVAQVKNGHWADATSTLAVMKPAMAADDATGQMWFEWMSHITTAATSPASDAQEALTNFARPHPFPLPLALYLDTLAALRRAGRAATAVQVLTIARGAYPDSPSLKEQEAPLATALAAAQAAAPALPSLARPTVAPEAEFFRALDDPLKNADPAAALAQVRAARAAAPAWLATRDEELRRTEIILAARLNDPVALSTAANLWLTTSTARLNAAVALARQLHEANLADSAARLLGATLRKSPGFAPAVRLLAEWSPTTTSANASGVKPTAAPTASLTNEKSFFDSLGDPFTAADPAAALAQVRAARTAAPAWIIPRDSDLRRAEIILAARLNDTTAVSIAARLWLTNDTPRANAGVTLARQLHDAGGVAEATLLVNEVLRKIPAFPPATRLLNEWAALPTGEKN
jgi:hypothetical protein